MEPIAVEDGYREGRYRIERQLSEGEMATV